MGSQSHAPAALSPRKRAGTHFTGGWMVPRAGAENLASARTRSPNRSARSESLYRLSSLGPTRNWNCSNNSDKFTVSLDLTSSASSPFHRLLFHYNVHSLAAALMLQQPCCPYVFTQLTRPICTTVWNVGGGRKFVEVKNGSSHSKTVSELVVLF